MEKLFQVLSIVKFVVISVHILFALSFVTFVIPKNGPFFVAWNLLFYGLLSLNTVLGILAALKELFATEVISCILTLIAIIASFAVGRQHLIVLLALNLIFILTCILALLLCLKARLDFLSDDEVVSDQRSTQVANEEISLNSVDKHVLSSTD